VFALRRLTDEANTELSTLHVPHLEQCCRVHVEEQAGLMLVLRLATSSLDRVRAERVGLGNV
jgi:hypothetical protein